LIWKSQICLLISRGSPTLDSATTCENLRSLDFPWADLPAFDLLIARRISFSPGSYWRRLSPRRTQPSTSHDVGSHGQPGPLRGNSIPLWRIAAGFIDLLSILDRSPFAQASALLMRSPEGLKEASGPDQVRRLSPRRTQPSTPHDVGSHEQPRPLRGNSIPLWRTAGTGRRQCPI
jgi:hypothetical protein